MIKHVLMKDLILNTILFVDGLVIVPSTEYEMQKYSICTKQYSYQIQFEDFSK